MNKSEQQQNTQNKQTSLIWIISKRARQKKNERSALAQTSNHQSMRQKANEPNRRKSCNEYTTVWTTGAATEESGENREFIRIGCKVIELYGLKHVRFHCYTHILHEYVGPKVRNANLMWPIWNWVYIEICGRALTFIRCHKAPQNTSTRWKKEFFKSILF